MKNEDKALAITATVAALAAIAGAIQGDPRFAQTALVIVAIGGVLKAFIST
jgi:hypothetical protein